MLIADKWMDYELIDTGDGDKLERWGKFYLKRPDPQVIWPVQTHLPEWDKPHAHYHRSATGGGNWEYFLDLPERWTVSYGDLSFFIKPLGFKHTGLFPEQAVNWDWMMQLIRSQKEPVRVLNLFAYTGGATVSAASAGAEVCHVDAAKGMVIWAKENMKLSHLENRPVRFIVDDVLKFVQREKRRNQFYDAILMDPPSYGRGPNGEMWKMEDELYGLVQACVEILSSRPLFFLINSYTTGLSPAVLQNVLRLTLGAVHGGKISAEEIGLPITNRGLILPCGSSGRWEA